MAHQGLDARTHGATGHGDEVVDLLGAGGQFDLGDEHALAQHVTGVLLDDQVAVVRILGRDPLESVDPPKGILARVWTGKGCEQRVDGQGGNVTGGRGLNREECL